MTQSERKSMVGYWEEHSQSVTGPSPSKSSSLNAMMLDTNASMLTELEVPEILGMLPDEVKESSLNGPDVLELASGVGRFTSKFASYCNSVTAVEFMPAFHQENQEKHESFSNVKCVCQDVTTLSLPSESVDFIFSNWLLMYLGDNEVKDLAQESLKWIRPNGYLFFRESCFRQSGNAKRTTNPTHYRHPSEYIKAFRSAFIESKNIDDDSVTISYFELVSSKSVAAYRKLKQNHGQVCFLWKKVTKSCTRNEITSFQKFLDEQQYSTQSIKRYEKIFGDGYVSTGGQVTTTEFVKKLNLVSGNRVLDVGCGIGGGDFYMAKTYGASVVGIDLSTNMIHVALERAMEASNSSLDVEFEICDATTKEFDSESFDVVYSRDTILHIKDKLSLFKKFFKILKPGGKLLISDYCCGTSLEDGTASDRYKSYVASRGYHLLTPESYGKVLSEAGFTNVSAEDRTSQFIEVLKSESSRASDNKDLFISQTSEKDFDDIMAGWTSKIERCNDGDQKWGLFYATKPL